MTPLLFLKNAVITFGGEPLFQDISFHIMPEERICLIGRNGCGKSTLLKVLAGEVQLDAGEYYVKPGTQIGYLPQVTTFDEADSVYDYVLQGLVLQEGESYADKTYLADQVLTPLNLIGTKPMKRLSGGKLRRATLAKALIAKPDILLLDEPTNHLDLTSIEWLESYLRSYQGSVVCISHDRAFLRAISEKTFWLDRGKLRVNGKGYQHFEEWSSHILQLEVLELQKLSKKMEAENLWLQQGVTARRKRNQQRLGEVFRLREKLQADRNNQRRVVATAKLPPLTANQTNSMVLEMEEVAHEFHDVTPPKRTLTNLSLRIMKGERVGMAGRNGAGKTTFLRLLTGALAPVSGRIRLGNNVQISYFDQKREALDPARTLWETLCPEGGDTVKVGEEFRHVSAYLKDFLFDSSQMHSPVSSLSGGEASRLLLARMLANPGNFLILDEPTNDLDMDTLDLLQDILSSYNGTLLIVSHDRDFLDRIVTRTLVFEGDGTVEDYVGGYSDYVVEQKAAQMASRQAARKKEQEHSIAAPKNTAAKLSYKHKRELEQLPEQIERLMLEVQQLEATMDDPAFYATNPEAFNTTAGLLEEKKQLLATAEIRWLELEEMRDAVEG